MSQLHIAVAQINTGVNNFKGNVEAHLAAREKFAAQGADLVVYPELSISGYALEDSVENPDLLAAGQKALEILRKATEDGGPGMVVALPQRYADEKIYNTSVLLHEGKGLGTAVKNHLPNYNVFDEKRNYAAGTEVAPIEFKGRKLGVLICEDTWFPDVAQRMKDQGAEVLISMNASPFEVGKMDRRLDQVIHQRVKETGLAMLYVNEVGGQDQIVFDGYSTAMNPDGNIAYLGKGFEESFDMLTLNFEPGKPAYFTDQCLARKPEDPMEAAWQALVLGTRDYMRKTGFKEAILGMSGGIDSAVVAAIAVDAIGPENVTLYRLPSRYTEDLSNNEAVNAAKLLGAEIDCISIEPMFAAFQQNMKPHFEKAAVQGKTKNVATANENAQARARGTILMGLSNASGALLLSTGNKSEISVGYCTLYGDMNGGFNPLKDAYKTTVFELARWRNSHHATTLLGPKGIVIPEAIINRPPSAELAPDQKDQDTLPPYEVLDAILKGYIESQLPLAEIADKTQQPRELVDHIVRLVDINEYKRRQSAPGVKIGTRSLGNGRRYPIAQPPLPKAIEGLEP